MRRIIIIMLIIILLAPISGFANSTKSARGKYGAGIILPLPIALHINLGNFDLDI
ncbi:BAPKO_0422 family outer member beta-barrel protein, partial [Borreliella garinii]